MRSCILILCIITLLSGCALRPRVGAPWMQKLLSEGPETDNMLFKQGWIDGCETGISTTSNALQRHFYSFKQDPYWSQNRDYYIGWKLSFWYCSRYVMQWLRRTII